MVMCLLADPMGVISAGGSIGGDTINCFWMFFSLMYSLKYILISFAMPGIPPEFSESCVPGSPPGGGVPCTSVEAI